MAYEHAPPPGYVRAPLNGVCKCPRAYATTDGTNWCCNQRQPVEPAESSVADAIDAECWPKVDYEALKRIGRELLVAIGENPDRPGIVDTPRRFADAWREFIEYDPGTLDTTFQTEGYYDGRDQTVAVRGIRVWSLCEHHLHPFWCDVSIAYRAQDRVIGLSKLARIAHKHAHRLQLQERLVRDIADEVQERIGSNHVAVKAEGEHLCMIARGIRSPGTMATLDLRGVFKTDRDLRQEFYEIVGRPVASAA